MKNGFYWYTRHSEREPTIVEVFNDNCVLFIGEEGYSPLDFVLKEGIFGSEITRSE